MGFQVGTHLLLWWALSPEQVRPATRKLLTSTDPPVLFRVVSLWEVAIKAPWKRADFQVNPAALRAGLLQEGFRELSIEAGHVLAVEHVAWIHREPFDRLLVAQAALEGLRLLTTDRTLAGYGEHVGWVAG